MSTSTVAGVGRFVSKRETSGGWSVGRRGAGLTLLLSGIADRDTTLVTLAVSTSYHIVIRFNASQSTDFFINGSLAESVAGASNPTTNTGQTIVGQDPGGAEVFNGFLDEVAIYADLSDTRILAHYTAAVTGVAPAASLPVASKIQFTG
jgi:hypothetical protein